MTNQPSWRLYRSTSREIPAIPLSEADEGRQKTESAGELGAPGEEGGGEEGEVNSVAK
jgi:hypothetical protein